MSRVIPRLLSLLAVGGALAAAPGVAAARPASRGFHAEAGMGATVALGDAQDDLAPGPMFGLRLGYDLTSWLALGVAADASSHEATVPPPPEGEWVQLYGARAVLRLGARAGGLALYAEGGAGGAYLSSNVLTKVGVQDPGERFSLALSAGGGLEYQLQNRHYAFGLGADYTMAPGFASLQTVSARLFLRYTYGGAH